MPSNDRTIIHTQLGIYHAHRNFHERGKRFNDWLEIQFTQIEYHYTYRRNENIHQASANHRKKRLTKRINYKINYMCNVD